MDSITIIQAFMQHMEWADAVVFSTILGKREAEVDEILLARLRHIHLVQRIFLDVWNNKQIQPRQTESMDIYDLLEFSMNNNREIQQYLGSLSVEQLDLAIKLPWAQEISQGLGFEIIDPSLGQTLLQVPTHSTHHRGQVNSRLREIGITPAMTDYIAWVWGNNPSPNWPAQNA